jgi:hypothetical protein
MNMLKKDKTKAAALMSIGRFARTRVCSLTESMLYCTQYVFHLNVFHLNDICAAAMNGRCGQCMKARRSIPFSRVQYVVPCGQFPHFLPFLRRAYSPLEPFNMLFRVDNFHTQ